MTSPPESEAAVAEPTEADTEFAREISMTISYTQNSQVRYKAALDIVAEIRSAALAESRASAEGKWIAVSSPPTKNGQFVGLYSIETTPALGIVGYDVESGWSDSECLSYWTDLPTLPPAPKASGR